MSDHGRKMSDHGRKLLTKWEGLALSVYDDVAGFKTIGVGHKLTPDELKHGYVLSNGASGWVLIEHAGSITKAEADMILVSDLRRFEDVVNSLGIELSQNQFDSLVSFAFNVGVTAFSTSTLARKLREGDFSAVEHQLMRWTKSGRQVVPGLVNRRRNECALWRGDV